MKNAAVSVVMSVYNAQQYLNEAIDSILFQTFEDFEFIIVNDGSTDNSLEIINSFKDERIKIINQNNTGLATALNNAIKHTSAPLIARLDADDVAMPERLELQFNFLNTHTDYVLVGSNAEVIDEEGYFIYKSRLPLNWEEILEKFPVSSFYHSAVMFRRDAFYKSGGYLDALSKFNCFEDSILWYYMKNLGKMCNIEQSLIKYRLLQNASTSKGGKEAKIRNRVFKNILVDGKISDENEIKLAKLKDSINIAERKRTYHLFIAKKLLWNNYQPVKAREHLRKSIGLKINNFYPYLLILFSYLPQGLINYIYNLKKSAK